MTRLCAILAPTSAEAERELVQMGGRTVYTGPSCALGTLPDAQPYSSAGPYAIALPSSQAVPQYIEPLPPHLLAPASDRQTGNTASLTPTHLVGVGQVTLYNRVALLTILQHAGWYLSHQCSDGELLLAYYACMGIDGLAQVSGMVACAIWDGATLTLMRDAVGARKLFYAQAGGCYAVSQSLYALRHWPRLPTRLNLAAVRSFLTFAYLPGEETLLEGVQEVVPGECVQLSLNEDGWRRERSRRSQQEARLICQQSRYWHLREQTWDERDPPELYARHLRSLLETAVQACLPPGEPVAVLLSGGLDSSLVLALAARLHDAPVTAYSIHFGTHHPNELAYAQWVAQHCGVPHRVLHVTGKQVVSHLPETMAALDSPVGEPLTVPNLLLDRTVAAEGFRVLLNGEGGDPCFGGPKNIPMLLFALHTDDPSPLARARAYLRSYRGCYDDLPLLLTSDAQDALRNAPMPERFVLPFFESPDIRSYLNRLMMINVRTKGAHHILAKVEALTSSAGLVGHSPLFHRDIVEYSFAIPPRFKLVGTTEKWILKQAVHDLLPHTVLYRPKSGMRTPVGAWLRGLWGRTPAGRWLRGPLGNLAADVLSGPQGRGRGLFRADTIRAWLRGEQVLWPRHANKVWLVLTLELWLREFYD